MPTRLWFRDRAEEAVRFYGAVLPGARVLDEARAGPDGPLVGAKAYG